MADRVSVSITIGGDLAANTRDQLVALVNLEGLSIEWDGPEFEVAHLPVDAALVLCAYEVAWGRLDDLEAFCIARHLPFTRWSGGCSGTCGAERAIFTGDGGVRSFAADDRDEVVMTRAITEQLGSYAAIRAYFDAADFVVPPLRLIG